MSHEYSYILTSLLDGSIREEIPLESIKYSRPISDSGGFTATAPLWTGATIDAFNKITRTNIQPSNTELWVLRDGVVIWGGIIWTVKASVENRRLTIGGQDHWSYFSHRLFDKRQTWTNIEQFTIVKNVLDYAQSKPNGDIGLVVPTATASGVTRTQRVYRNEYRRVADVITELAELENGFDFTIDYSGDIQSGFTKTFSIATRRGRRLANTTFAIGKNVELLSYDEDGTSMANTVVAIGAGQGSQMRRSVATDATQFATFPLLETVFTHKSLQTTALVNALAAEELKRRTEAPRSVGVKVVSEDPDAHIGSFIAGDDVKVHCDYGWLNIDEYMRIMSYDVTIDAAGKETIDVKLTQVEGTV